VENPDPDLHTPTNSSSFHGYKMKTIHSLLLFCLIAICLAGCGSEVGKTTDSNAIENENHPSDLYQPKYGEADPIALPDAHPGGTFSTWGGSFPKSLNMFLDYNRFSANVMGLLYEPLISLHSKENRPVGVLAESWSVGEDQMSFTFKIRKDATWCDGNPVTSADIQFFYDVILDPQNLTSLFRVSLKRFERPVAVDEKTIMIKANTKHWNNFFQAGNMFAFPAHLWKGKDFNKINFNFPVVSGPYALGEVKKGRSISLVRRHDWWGRTNRYNAGKYNFQKIIYRSMTDRNKALEAFKKGIFDAYPIYTSSIWMKQTDFEQVQKGWVVRQAVYNRQPKGYQGLAVNLRKPKFQDIRVRQALGYLLNREAMNEKFMYNQYFLLNSFYPDLYPENINPKREVTTYDPEKARHLLADAGWAVNGVGMLEKEGHPFEITFLSAAEDFRHLNLYIEDLKAVGIQAKIEKINRSTLTKRIDNFEFEMFWTAWGASRLRDPESSWHSSTADQKASQNYTGVQDELVDRLIDAQKLEYDMDKRIDILKQIDARLAEMIPYIFLWQSDHGRILYWNKYRTPEYVYDKYGQEDSIITYWWEDSALKDELERAMNKEESLAKKPFKVVYEE
jgi:microcin C transport system substrate-binding protein